MTTVLTGGKFNKLHPGHIWLLKRAKEIGDRVVVVLANDKNNDRPYALPAAERKIQMEKLDLADEVAIGDEKNFMKVVEKFHPDIILLGYDQKLPKGLESKLKGVKIIQLERHGNYSSGKL
jgi:FAD synthetase